jgi:dipicolinate synthase subunit A
MHFSNQNKTIVFIGGDIRQLEAAKTVKQHGYNPLLMGFDSIDTAEIEKLKYFDLPEEVCALVLPVAGISESGEIPATFSDKKIFVSDFAEKISDSITLVLGKSIPSLTKLISEKSIKIVELLKMEEFAILNAIPTAEGAIQLAMENTAITIHGSTCMVLGFGRIGRILSRMLKGIGASVLVEARKAEDIAWIKVAGFRPVHQTKLSDYVSKADIIFNTVPALMLSEHLIEKLKKDVLVIDLASAPGGVDIEAAKRLNVKAITAPGLPGKVAPRTAGRIIGDLIATVCRDQGI